MEHCFGGICRKLEKDKRISFYAQSHLTNIGLKTKNYFFKKKGGPSWEKMIFNPYLGNTWFGNKNAGNERLPHGAFLNDGQDLISLFIGAEIGILEEDEERPTEFSYVVEISKKVLERLGKTMTEKVTLYPGGDLGKNREFLIEFFKINNSLALFLRSETFDSKVSEKVAFSSFEKDIDDETIMNLLKNFAEAPEFPGGTFAQWFWPLQ